MSDPKYKLTKVATPTIPPPTLRRTSWRTQILEEFLTSKTQCAIITGLSKSEWQGLRSFVSMIPKWRDQIRLYEGTDGSYYIVTLTLWNHWQSKLRS